MIVNTHYIEVINVHAEIAFGILKFCKYFLTFFLYENSILDLEANLGHPYNIDNFFKIS